MIARTLPGLALAAALVVSLAAGAQAGCPGDTQMEMNDCAARDFERADSELNQVYRQLGKVPELIAAEKAWIAFRDAECAYQASGYKGGSMAPMVYANCMQSLTEDRTRQLRQSLSAQ